MKKISPKGIIIDADNTLLKTKEFVISHIKEVCMRLNLETTPTEMEIMAILRKNLEFEKIFDTLFGNRGPEILENYRRDAMNIHFQSTEGGLNFIKKTVNQGIPVIVVTNRTRSTEERLSQSGFQLNCFLAILSPPEGIRKPDQRSYNEAIKKLNGKGIKLDEIVIIGDDADDFRACPENLRSQFVGVLSGPSTREDFEKAGVKPEQLVHSLNEVKFSSENQEPQRELRKK